MPKIKLSTEQIADGDYEDILKEVDAAAEMAPCTVTLEVEITTDEQDESEKE